MIKSINGLEYGGKYHTFFWDNQVNPNATISNGLANCTTFVYGDVLVDRGKPIVSKITNANNFHNNLINGWIAIPYEYSKVNVGDCLEWVNKNHIARVSDINKKIYISGSFYTGEHGKAYYNGNFDTRNFTNLKDLSDFMISKYPYRFFHFCDLDTENSWVNGTPSYILVQPIKSVERNNKVNQIQVLTDVQYVRDNDKNIISGAESGFYNVLNTKEDGYTWYEVETNKWIASVSGRVVYLPKEITKDIKNENEELKKQIENYKKILKDIHSLSEVE